jgi:hypothetical protein
MRRESLTLSVAVALIIGCGSDGATASVDPTPQSISPIMAEHYRCDQVTFLPGVILQPGTAERDLDEAAAFLRQFLASPQSDELMPDTGWRRLGHTGRFVEFANYIDDPAWNSYVWITFESDGAAWSFFRGGACQPERVVQGDLESLAWWLPDGVPDPTARSISISVVVAGCSSGPPVDAIQPPLIEMAADRATTMLTGRRDANPDCPVGVPTPWTIDLPEEIGNRLVLDGSVFPGRDATTEPLGFGGTGG